MLHQFVVKWCDITSMCFKSANSVRTTGGILSPIFFNVFVDELSHKLTNANVGCHINSVCLNHLFYADDTV